MVSSIETDNLTLREHRIVDFNDYIPLWTQRLPGVDGAYRFPPLRDEDVWHRLLRWIGHRHVFGFAPFLVFDRRSRRLCGEVGFGHFNRGNGPDSDDAPEAMWTLHPDFHGKGIAIEATAAAIGWLDEHHPMRRSVCMIEPDNAASLKIAARFGFHEFRQGHYRDRPALFLERSG